MYSRRQLRKEFFNVPRNLRTRNILKNRIYNIFEKNILVKNEFTIVKLQASRFGTSPDSLLHNYNSFSIIDFPKRRL